MNTNHKKGRKHHKTQQKQKIRQKKNITPWLLGGIIVLTLILYGSSVKHQFVDLDDPQYILNNHLIKNLNAERLSEIFTTFKNGNYHPLTTLVNAIHYNFFQQDPMPYHATNLLLHLLNICLVFYLIFLITKEPATSFITALFFAIHPFHVESVSWASELKDVLYTFFYLGGLATYFLYIRRNNDKKYYALSLLLFLFSCFSKSAAITLPVLLILLDYYHGRKIRGAAIYDKIPYFAISIVFGILAILSQQAEGAIRDINMENGIFDKVFYVTYSISYYIIGIAFPFNLAAIHPYPKYVDGVLPIEYYLSPLLIVMVIWLIYKSKKHQKDLIFGSLFFLVTLSMVIQIIPLGQAIVAERYTYVPYIGPFFIIGRYYSKVLKRTNRIVNPLFFVLLAFAIFFSIKTFNRNMVWRSSITLFEDASEKYPGQNNLIYNNLGTSKFNKGDYRGAIEAFDKAIELGVNDATALNNRGSAKFALGRTEEALKDFNLAIQQYPDFSESYRNRGVVRYKQGNIQGSIDDYSKCIELNPNDDLALYYRGVSRFKLNDVQGACSDWQKASRLGNINAVDRIKEHCQ